MENDRLILTDEQVAQAEVLASFLASPYKVLGIGTQIVAKVGPELNMAEVENINFIRKHTDIPVPKILNSYETDGTGYILMSRVEGQRLDVLWPKLPPEAKTNILLELHDFIGQMRQIPPPQNNWIQSVTGGPVTDRRVMGVVTGGPFESEDQFNTWQLSQLIPNRPLFHQDMYQAMHKTHHRVVFTHADLGFQNILVKDGHVTALLDWEDSGWFPEHWEYCKTAGYLAGSDELYLALKQMFDDQYFEEYLMEMWFSREVKHGGF